MANIRKKLTPTLITASMALVVGCTIILYASYLPTFDVSVVLFSLSILICLIFIFAKTGSKLKRDFFEPPRLLAILYLMFFPVFGLFYLHFPALGKWYLKNYYVPDFASEVSRVCFYVALSLPLFYLGYRVGYKSIPKFFLRIMSKDEDINYRRIIFWSFVFIIFGTINLAILIRDVGGISYIIREGFVPTRKGVTNTLNFHFAYFLVIVSLVMMSVNFYCKKSKLKKFFYIVISLISASLLSLTGTRELALVILVLPLINIYYYSYFQENKTLQLRKLLPVACLFFVVFLLIFSWMTNIRVKKVQKRMTIWYKLSEFNVIDTNCLAFERYLKTNSLLWGQPLIAPFFRPYFKFFVYGIRGRPLVFVLPEKWRFTPDRLVYGTSSVPIYAITSTPGISFAGEMYINFWWFGYVAFFIAGIFFGKYRKALEIVGFKFWGTMVYVLFVWEFCFEICVEHGFSGRVIPVSTFILQILLFKFLSSTSLFQKR